MRKQNKRVETASPVNEDQFGYLGDAKNEIYFHPQPKVLNIFPVAGDPEFLVREVLKRDLSKVEKIRFDPVNVCNLACIFCTSDLKTKHAQISPDSLQSILHRVSQTCLRIYCGCGYEPLMAKNIEEYIQTIRKVVSDEFPIKPKINMVTNGLLLGQRNLDSFIECLDWIHISVHSHRKEKFEKIEKRANFDNLVSNIKKIRKKYTNLNIHFEFVVNQVNKEDVEEYIHWAFKELQVDSINLKRIAVVSFHHKSYLADSVNAGSSLGLSDEEWHTISRKISKSWPNKLSNVPAFSSHDQMLTKSAMTDVIEL
jgi:molybdenum cofactor biosynthesis enzyme MoaA